MAAPETSASGCERGRDTDPPGRGGVINSFNRDGSTLSGFGTVYWDPDVFKGGQCWPGSSGWLLGRG